MKNKNKNSKKNPMEKYRRPQIDTFNTYILDLAFNRHSQ